MSVQILIPAYQPDEKLADLVGELCLTYPVTVVDDGSGKEYAGLFQRVEELLHDALRNGADVERADLLHDTLDLLRRDAVAAQTQGFEYSHGGHAPEAQCMLGCVGTKEVSLPLPEPGACSRACRAARCDCSCVRCQVGTSGAAMGRLNR